MCTAVAWWWKECLAVVCVEDALSQIRSHINLCHRAYQTNTYALRHVGKYASRLTLGYSTPLYLWLSNKATSTQLIRCFPVTWPLVWVYCKYIPTCCSLSPELQWLHCWTSWPRHCNVSVNPIQMYAHCLSSYSHTHMC